MQMRQQAYCLMREKMSPQVDEIRRRIEKLEEGLNLVEGYQPIILSNEWSPQFKLAIHEIDRLYYLALKRGDTGTATKAAHELNQLLKTQQPSNRTPTVYIHFENEGEAHHQ